MNQSTPQHSKGQAAMAAYIANGRKDPDIAAALDNDLFFTRNYDPTFNMRMEYLYCGQLPPQLLDMQIVGNLMRTQNLLPSNKLPPFVKVEMPTVQEQAIKREEDHDAHRKALAATHLDAIQRRLIPPIPMPPYAQSSPAASRASGSMPPPSSMPMPTGIPSESALRRSATPAGNGSQRQPTPYAQFSAAASRAPGIVLLSGTMPIRNSIPSNSTPPRSAMLSSNGGQRQLTPHVPMSPYAQILAAGSPLLGSMPPPGYIPAPMPSTSAPRRSATPSGNGSLPQSTLISNGYRVQNTQNQPQRSFIPVPMGNMTRQTQELMRARGQLQPAPQASPQVSMMAVPAKPNRSRAKKASKKD